MISDLCYKNCPNISGWACKPSKEQSLKLRMLLSLSDLHSCPASTPQGHKSATVMEALPSQGNYGTGGPWPQSVWVSKISLFSAASSNLLRLLMNFTFPPSRKAAQQTQYIGQPEK